jgi:hypothetical protein
VTLASLASPAEIPLWPCDAVVYDLDYLADHERRHILDELTCGPVERLAAVHSYNLRPSQKRTLRRNGVVVHRRLHPGWFARLLRRKSGEGRSAATAFSP